MMLPFKKLSWSVSRMRCNFATTVAICHSEPKFCIVGSGPAGFYTAQGLLKSVPNASVDIYEKLPVPFGLIRYGVAPDHPEVKNAINTFTNTAGNQRFSFNGNVNVGKDVTLTELQEAYHSVILCTGAEHDRHFGIPGEDLSGVISARRFVGWYNGLPTDSDISVNLDNVETVAVLGHGNVALDVARILLTNVDELRKTDITEVALEALSRSRVKKVHLIGRRGPLQVAFTIKELREMINLKGCQAILKPTDFCGIDRDLEGLQRPRKRLTELMLKQASISSHVCSKDLKQWELTFLRSPVKFLASENTNVLRGILLNVNTLEDSGKNPKALPTGETEIHISDLLMKIHGDVYMPVFVKALRSIGYRSLPVDNTLPFDHFNGRILNIDGRVNGKPGMYCSGWAAMGPVGVILSTMNDSFQLSRAIVADIANRQLDVSRRKGGRDDAVKILKNRNIQIVSFRHWEKIDAEEKNRGQRAGKPREKITNVQEMLSIAK